MYDSGTYCMLLGVEHGYIFYRFLSDGELSSASFWRFPEVILVGDAYAWWGVPTLIRSTRYWTETTFETEEYVILISARHDNLYSRVQYLSVRYR